MLACIQESLVTLPPPSPFYTPNLSSLLYIYIVYIPPSLPSSLPSSLPHLLYPSLPSSPLRTPLPLFPLTCRPPGHLSPRVVCSAMQNKIFKTTLQQDSQEFMRCLLMQIHDETAVEVPLWVGVANKSHDRSCDTPGGSSSRNSTASSASHDSNEFLSSSVDRNSPVLCKTSPLPWKKGLARLSLKQKPTGSIQSLTHGSPTNYRRFTLRGPSSSKLRSGSRESDETGGHLLLQIPTEASEISLESQPSEEEAAGGGGCVRGEEGMVYEVDLTTRYITVHRDCHIFDVGESTEGACSGGSDTVSGRNRAHSSNSTQLRQKKIPGQGSVYRSADNSLTTIRLHGCGHSFTCLSLYVVYNLHVHVRVCTYMCTGMCRCMCRCTMHVMYMYECLWCCFRQA